MLIFINLVQSPQQRLRKTIDSEFTLWESDFFKTKKKETIFEGYKHTFIYDYCVHTKKTVSLLKIKKSAMKN